MAKVGIFAAYDSRVKAFMAPFTALHVGQVHRSWEETCNDGKSLMSKHPADFSLYQVGEFDETTGVVTPLEKHYCVATALQVKQTPESPLPFKQMNN